MGPLAVGGILSLGEQLIKRLFPDKAEQDAALLKLRELDQQGALSQIQVNMEEAKSESTFVAGWRPFVGWVCGSALAYQYVVRTVAYDAATFMGKTVELTPLDLSVMLPVLLGMLGLAGARSFEKAKGVNKVR